MRRLEGLANGDGVVVLSRIRWMVRMNLGAVFYSLANFHCSAQGNVDFHAADLPLSILAPATILDLFLDEPSQVNASVEDIRFGARIADPPVIVQILGNLSTL